MSDHDQIDRNFLIVVIVGLLCIAALAWEIFPRHEAPGGTPAASAPAKK